MVLFLRQVLFGCLSHVIKKAAINCRAKTLLVTIPLISLISVTAGLSQTLLLLRRSARQLLPLFVEIIHLFYLQMVFSVISRL